MKKLTKNFALLFLLTAIFIFDDVLIYLLVKNVFEWQATGLLLALGAFVVIGLNVSLALLVLKIMQKRPTTGAQGMIGKTGVVLKKVKGGGQVKVEGEIWSAESDDKIEVGQKVIVEKVDGLKLLIKKLNNKRTFRALL